MWIMCLDPPNPAFTGCVWADADWICLPVIVSRVQSRNSVLSRSIDRDMPVSRAPK